MTTATDRAAPPAGWLRGVRFDATLIAGAAALALLSGLAVAREPRLFGPILFLDLWLLGYHHVIASYTRLCFDRASLRAHRFLVFGLPPLVLAATLALALGVGFWVLASVYLYWQWFHYTRQSHGIAQVYRRKAGGRAEESETVSRLALYLLPLWGILHRSAQDPGRFLGLELKVLPVPALAVEAAAAAALAALGCWLAMRALAWWRGRLPVAHTLYLLSHFAVFYVGYIAIDEINHGWLVVNIWHNAQYILFVWLFNTNRFKAGIDPEARFLSALSQRRNAGLYVLACLGISTLLYLAIWRFGVLLEALALPAVIAIYQTLNFHHYIVDAVIWKVRRKPLQQTLGIAP